jgi:formylglycine-generating enzyme required for sulfatase activity
LTGKPRRGVHDLGGNVWEWTRSGYHQKKAYEDFPYDPEMDFLFKKGDYAGYLKKKDEKSRVFPALRGGSFFIGGSNCRCAYRYFDDPDGRNSFVGFRCARITL